MEFSSYGKKCVVQGYKNKPEMLILEIMNACIMALPTDALGHIKSFLEYTGGSVFASSTIIPSDVTLRVNGTYGGGDMVLGMTLIFMGLKYELLSYVLTKAVKEVCRNHKCNLKEIVEAG